MYLSFNHFGEVEKRMSVNGCRAETYGAESRWFFVLTAQGGT